MHVKCTLFITIRYITQIFMYIYWTTVYIVNIDRKQNVQLPRVEGHCPGTHGARRAGLLVDRLSGPAALYRGQQVRLSTLLAGLQGRACARLAAGRTFLLFSEIYVTNVSPSQSFHSFSFSVSLLQIYSPSTGSWNISWLFSSIFSLVNVNASGYWIFKLQIIPLGIPASPFSGSIYWPLFALSSFYLVTIICKCICWSLPVIDQLDLFFLF